MLGERLGLQFQGKQLRIFSGLRRNHVETRVALGPEQRHGDDVALVEPAERHHGRRATGKHHQRWSIVHVVLGLRIFGSREHLSRDIDELLAEQPQGLVDRPASSPRSC